MKKIFSFLLMAAILLAVGASVTSCSSGDDDDTISKQRVENYVVGHKWHKDNNKNSEYRFYRNGLVVSMSGGRVTSGMLTYAESNFFGTWSVVDNKLITTFTSGAYEGFDWNSILYGTLTINKLWSDIKIIDATAPNGDPHELSSLSLDFGSSNYVIDYTDTSDHDGALVGTWQANGHNNSEGSVQFTMTVSKKGNVRFTAPSIDIDFTSTCTTKNGHVSFNEYLTPAMRSYSFIYIREKDKILFYNEKNAQTAWIWEKVK